MIDTGGYVTGSEDVFEGAIREQVEEAMNEASVILFMADCHDGLTGLDNDFAKVVRVLKKPIMVVANKADTADWSYQSSEFYALAWAKYSQSQHLMAPEQVNCWMRWSNILRMKETRIRKRAFLESLFWPTQCWKIFFVNALLGKERTIVTDVAGTTRDSINTRYTLLGKISFSRTQQRVRKKSRVHEDIEVLLGHAGIASTSGFGCLCDYGGCYQRAGSSGHEPDQLSAEI